MSANVEPLTRGLVALAGGARCTLTVRVQPRARRAGAAGFHGGLLRIAVNEPPADGRANEAARDALAHALGLSRASVQLVAGARSREKRFAIDAPAAEVARALERLGLPEDTA